MATEGCSEEAQPPPLQWLEEGMRSNQRCVMQKAPLYLRREFKEDSYKPNAVSIGPFFYGLEIVQDIEKSKFEIVYKFIEESQIPISDFYTRVENLCTQAKLFYPENTRQLYTDKQFTQMFFLDTCFLVWVIHILSHEESIYPLSTMYLHMCVRDIFLMDNQIPFILVDELINLRFRGEGREMINKFLAMVIGASSSYVGHTDQLFDQSPRHLLELLRKKYIGISDFEEEILNNDPHLFPSAKGLHNRGIKIERRGFFISHFGFDSDNGILYMPPLCIDRFFKTTFLNMVAYEASLGDPGELKVTTYLCLFKIFVMNSESVDVLQGSVIYGGEVNETIVEMFQDMCTNLHPNFQLYGRLLNKLYGFRTGFAPSIRFWTQKVRQIVPW
uniref:Uncharacterized protein n=1 Tax=Davidia involucrata TaxID=16924 RepID=A0A5B6Z4I4_DAVIN